MWRPVCWSTWLSGKIFYLCVNDTNLSNCPKQNVWCLSWWLFQLSAQIATAISQNEPCHFLATISSPWCNESILWKMHCQAKSSKKFRGKDNWEAQVEARWRNSGGGTGVSQFGPPLGLYQTIPSLTSTWKISNQPRNLHNPTFSQLTESASV